MFETITLRSMQEPNDENQKDDLSNKKVDGETLV